MTQTPEDSADNRTSTIALFTLIGGIALGLLMAAFFGELYNRFYSSRFVPGEFDAFLAISGVVVGLLGLFRFHEVLRKIG